MNEWILLVWLALPGQCAEAEGYCPVEYEEAIEVSRHETLEACRVAESAYDSGEKSNISTCAKR